MIFFAGGVLDVFEIKLPSDYADQQTASLREEVERLREALEKMKTGMMNLIAYNIIPDSYCPDANELIDMAHNALNKKEY